MPLYLIFGLCLWAPLALAASDTPAPSDHDLAYSLGASLGERLREEVPGLQLDALLEGLQQSYRNQPLKLDKTRIQAILQQHEDAAGAVAEQVRTEQLQGAEKRFMATERGRTGVRELAEGVLYTEQASGTGKQPTAHARVQVRYKGMLPDGTVFDQSQQPQWFSLDSVIEGWRVALATMKAGAKGRLVIASPMAYGAEGAGDLIAPYTPLVFEIELLAVEG